MQETGNGNNTHAWRSEPTVISEFGSYGDI